MLMNFDNNNDVLNYTSSNDHGLFVVIHSFAVRIIIWQMTFTAYVSFWIV
jgi:hypothetical protein